MGVVVELKYCLPCNNEQPLRAKHCSFCKKCIPLYDHHCPWIGNRVPSPKKMYLGNCIGEKNKLLFMLYLMIQLA